MPAALLFALPALAVLVAFAIRYPREALAALTDPAVLVVAVLLTLPLLLRS